MEWLAGINLPDLTLNGILLLSLLWTVHAIYSGKLVPRQHLDDAIADRDAWKEVALAEQGTNAKQSAQLDRLLAAVEGSQRVVAAIPKAAEVEQP